MIAIASDHGGYGAGIVGPNLAERMVDVFLSTEFDGGRHTKRVELMMEIEG